ncbi:MAG: hypothetical protein KDF60_17035 [Calditrichaeota bacterium]|nr:hypothetical protein [Calditrichota bacterium]
MHKLRLLFWVLLFNASLTFAQVDLNGSLDLEMSYGGKTSSFLKNEIANDFRRPHLAINQFNLFLFSDMGSDFFFNSRLQWDTWGTGKINPLRITLATLSWEPQDFPVTVNIGRFVSPFGLYPKRSLASNSSFVNGPLAYNYFINISDTRGFWPKAGDSGAYGVDDVGLTTVYFGGYNTGAMLDWVIRENALNLALAFVNAASASQKDYTNLQNAAIVGRLGFAPFIFWQHGISFSYGSFMEKDPVNNTFDRLERFRQMVIATDWVLAYTYFELSGEFIYARWNVPGLTSTGFKTDFNGELGEFKLSNYSYYVDLKFEPPVLTGSYLAFRYETMVFENYDHPKTVSIIALNPWDTDITRYSAAVGYKISRNILLKLAVTDQKYKNNPAGIDDVTIRSILTFLF